MSSLLNYYNDNGGTVSSNDIGTDQPMPMDRCHHFYTTDNPSSWFFDLGQQTIGKRPVRQKYHVGHQTNMTSTQYVQKGKYDCKQPCWDRVCK